MGTDQIMYCIVALLLGMLLANMLKNVCGCKTVEQFDIINLVDDLETDLVEIEPVLGVPLKAMTEQDEHVILRAKTTPPCPGDESSRTEVSDCSKVQIKDCDNSFQRITQIPANRLYLGEDYSGLPVNCVKKPGANIQVPGMEKGIPGTAVGYCEAYSDTCLGVTRQLPQNCYKNKQQYVEDSTQCP